MRQEASQHIAHWKAEQSEAPEKSTQIPPLEKPAESPPLSKGGEGGFIGKDGAEMVLIPAGEFQMGSNDGGSDEKPVHTVYLDAFYMDKYEVTNALYKKFVDANPQWSKDRIDREYHDGHYLEDWNGNSASQSAVPLYTPGQCGWWYSSDLPSAGWRL